MRLVRVRLGRVCEVKVVSRIRGGKHLERIGDRFEGVDSGEGLSAWGSLSGSSLSTPVVVMVMVVGKLGSREGCVAVRVAPSTTPDNVSNWGGGGGGGWKVKSDSCPCASNEVVDSERSHGGALQFVSRSFKDLGITLQR